MAQLWSYGVEFELHESSEKATQGATLTKFSLSGGSVGQVDHSLHRHADDFPTVLHEELM